jgi:hypothetical protein
MKLKVILTGATGMVGEGVLHECLNHSEVEAVLSISRKPCGISHPKLVEILHSEFQNLDPIKNKLTGYNTCFFCMGVSSIGMDEEKYTALTHTLALHVAGILSAQNPNMVFCYISGAGTDSTEKGRTMWARVKGKTENDLMKLPFNKVFAVRPGFMRPTKGLKNTLSFYRYVNWMFPVLRKLFPKFVSTLKELGLAMIQAASNGYEKNILEVKDIVILARLAEKK